MIEEQLKKCAGPCGEPYPVRANWHKTVIDGKLSEVCRKCFDEINKFKGMKPKESKEAVLTPKKAVFVPKKVDWIRVYED